MPPPRETLLVMGEHILRVRVRQHDFTVEDQANVDLNCLPLCVTKA